MFVFVKHSRVSGITSLFLSSPEFPSPARRKGIHALPPDTHEYARTHGARQNIFTVSLFFVFILFNESKHWPCSPLPPSERLRLFAAQSSVGLVLVRLIRSWESIVVSRRRHSRATQGAH